MGNTKKKRNNLDNCSIGLRPINKQLINLSEKKNKTTKKKFVKELLSNFSPSHIKAKDDFYEFINYKWLKNVNLQKEQKYIVQVDDFRLTQDKVYRELNEIILEYIKTHNDKLSKNLKNFYLSLIKMNSKSHSRLIAKEYVNTVETFITNNNLYGMLSYINQNEATAVYAPLVFSIMPDKKNVKIFRSNISSHSFFILDLSVYYDDGTDVEYKKKYRNSFNKYVKTVFDKLLVNHNYNPKDVFDVEVEMFNAFDCRNIKNNDLYNKVYSTESLSKYGFDWINFSKQLGFKKCPDFFTTNSLPYLKCINEILIKNWNNPKWKTYWIFILLNYLLRITHDWKDITYNFYGKYERGQELQTQSKSAVTTTLFMSIPFNTFLTNEYVKKYENPQIIKYVSILCNDLKSTFHNILKRNKWLNPSTKKYALKKLKHFKFIYGVEKLIPDPDLNYSTNFYHNLLLVMTWRNKMFIELEGKPVIDLPMMDWTQYPLKMIGSQAYIVNASYTPTKNAIYINLGYLQKPFVDLDERGIEYNLAYLGNTLSHEMSHGFDNTGSLYGYDGNLYDWWTDQDKKIYKSFQADIVKQYETYALRDNITFDASIGLGEDLADISAVAICDEYLKNFQTSNNDIIPIRSLSYQSYYTYLAIQQKQYLNKKGLNAQLKTNPHPLDKYRCNVPISRSEIFRGLYNIKKGDGMWWHNTNSIW